MFKLMISVFLALFIFQGEVYAAECVWSAAGRNVQFFPDRSVQISTSAGRVTLVGTIWEEHVFGHLDNGKPATKVTYYLSSGSYEKSWIETADGGIYNSYTKGRAP